MSDSLQENLGEKLGETSRLEVRVNLVLATDELDNSSIPMGRLQAFLYSTLSLVGQLKMLGFNS